MKKIGLFLVFFVVSCALAMAQYPFFSHLDWLQWQSNPAYLGVNQQENLIFDYNRAWISNEVNSNTGLLQYDRALVNSKGRNVGGVGLSILNNRVNYREMFNRFQASLGAAYAMQIQRHVMLNFGLQGTYFADRVNNSGLVTGSQYIPGWGFDPNAGNNEPMSDLNTQYFGISAGLFLYKESSSALADNYLGVSVKNFNQPINSFYSEISRMPMQISAMGGLRLLQGLRNKLLGELWYSNSSGQGNLTLGAVYQLNNLINQRGSEENVHVRLISRYSTNNKFIVGAQALYNGFAIGASYDIPLSHTTERSYDSGFEVLLVLHRKTRPFKKRERKKSKYKPIAKAIPQAEPVMNQDTLAMEEEVIAASSEEHYPDTSKDHSGNASAGLLIDDKPVEGEVYFDFASKEMTEASETFLQQFVSAFYLQGKSMIIVTGHTDNMGGNAYNQQLSLNRAASVRQKLMSFGIDESQITIKGMGEEAPLVPNNSPENRAKNRRVEIAFY